MAARKKVVKGKEKIKSSKSVKGSVPPEEVEVKKEDDFFAGVRTLHGELFWEYRAKTAEYEKALLELKSAQRELNIEKADLRYKKLLRLFEEEKRLAGDLKEHAGLLRGVQLKAAANLGLELDEFLNHCLIDHETGVVRIIDQ